MNWSREDLQRLSALWKEGLTARQIGDKLGRGRNSIIGKAHALRLLPRPSPLGKGRPSHHPQHVELFGQDLGEGVN